MLVFKGVVENTLLHGRVLAGFDKPGREQALDLWERRQRRSQGWERKRGEGFDELGNTFSGIAILRKYSAFWKQLIFPKRTSKPC